MKRTFLMILGVCLLVAAGGAYAWHAAGAAQPSSFNVAGSRAAITRDLRALGPERAYAAFKTRYTGAGFSQKHNAAHLFGSLLYDERGLGGIGTCDADFNYGCYHGFMTEAIAQAGFAVIPQLTAACQKTGVAVSCEHGIGHGIVEYLNHKDLPRALAACAQTKPKDPIAGCFTGAFMEYNEPILFSNDGTARSEARPMADPKNPYDVCTSLDAAYAPACYFSLPQWWRQVYGPDYGKMGALCQRAPAFNDDCYAGVGNIVAPSADFDAAQTIAWCDAMPSAAGRSRCLVDAAGAFSPVPEKAADARTVCAAALPADRPSCGGRGLVN